MEETLNAPETEVQEIAPATTQSTSENGSAPSSEQEAQDGSTESAAAPSETELPKGWKWDGNVESLPEPFRERGKGMLRHFTEQSEKLAQQRKELEEQVKKLEAPPEKPKAEQPQVDPTEVYLNREFQDAIETGDTGKMLQVQNQLIDYRLQRQLKQLEPAYQSKIEELEKTSKQVQNTMILDEFGKKNPRLWTHRDSGLASMVVRELCDRQGKPLKDAYEMMEKISSFYQSEAKRSLNQDIQQKKQASAAVPTAPMETEYVWVNTQNEADRKNIELSAQGSSKIAKVKPK